MPTQHSSAQRAAAAQPAVAGRHWGTPAHQLLGLYCHWPDGETGLGGAAGGSGGALMCAVAAAVGLPAGRVLLIVRGYVAPGQ